MLTREQLLSLSGAFAAHVDRAEATLSNRIVGHARLFARLRAGKGCNLDTSAAAAAWFDENWPADLAWPADVPRPRKSKRVA